MNRKEAADLLPIIKAFSEGKEIEIFDKTTKMWKTAMLPHFDCDSKNYRIKPEPKYRSFKDAEECWQEMLKHQPFGWVDNKKDRSHSLIAHIKTAKNGVYINGIGNYFFNDIMEEFTFADGTPFGIKVEE